MYATNPLKRPQFVVKILNPANEEEAIINRLQRNTSTRNHVVPCEIIRSDPVVLIMPGLCEVDKPIELAVGPVMVLCSLLKVLHQIAEVRVLHTSYVSASPHTMTGNRSLTWSPHRTHSTHRLTLASHTNVV